MGKKIILLKRKFKEKCQNVIHVNVKIYILNRQGQLMFRVFSSIIYEFFGQPENYLHILIYCVIDIKLTKFIHILNL